MKKITTIFTCDPLQKVHLNKDVLLAGEHLAETKGYQHELVGFRTPNANNERYTMKNDDAEPGVYGNSKITLIEENEIKNHLIKEAKNIDILVLFHFSLSSLRLAKQFKKLNKDGKVYIKLDMSQKYKPKLLQKNVLKMIYKMLFVYPSIKKYVDIYSVETTLMYNYLKEKGLCGYDIDDKLVLMPSGLDNDLLEHPKKSFAQKDNLIITVGRLGTEPKNNEMFIAALKNVDLKDFKVAFIGPYTEEFKALFDKTITDYPHLKDKLLLTGNISDKAELFSWYNKSKAFVLTSKWESFGLVLTEALAFGNYIISTDVGGARDITDNFRLGAKADDSVELASELQKCIDNQVLSESLYKQIQEQAKQFAWEKLINNSFSDKFNLK